MDPRAVWNLTGILIRNGQRLGLHKNDQTAGLTAFEIEMRRRIWFQILLLDIMAAQTVGTSSSMSFLLQPTVDPLNVNDSDLHPDMQRLPEDSEGATEMMFCRLRLKIFGWFHQLHSEKPASSTSEGIPNMASGIWPAEMANDMDKKERMIDKIEQQVELDLLRYCDPLDPVHYLTTFVARLIVTKMKFAALHPRRQAEGAVISQQLKDQLFRLALRVIQYDNAAHGEKMMQRFLWHSHAHFQWSCFMHILDDLKERNLGPEADTAWEEVDKVYRFRPEITQGRKLKLPLYMAVHKVLLISWSHREHAAAQAGQLVDVPQCVITLRDRANSAVSLRRDSSMEATPNQSNIGLAMFQPPNNSDWSTSFNFGDLPSLQNNASAFNQYEDNNGFMFSSNAAPVDWSVFDNMINDASMSSYEAYVDNTAMQPGSWQMGAQS